MVWGLRLTLFTALMVPSVGAESTHAQTAAPAVELAEAKPRAVDVGGRSLMLRTLGEGEPTVVIEAGAGLPAAESDEWKTVVEAIAKTNRVCLYSRAGLGSSDPPPTKTFTSRDVAKDLHELLKAADIQTPVVLVGHSLGGMHARVYAGMFPEDVAGVVLVDSAHPDQDERWLADLPAEQPDDEAPLKRAREFLTRRVNDRGANPDRLDWVASRQEARDVKTFGDIPLAVLTHCPEWKIDPSLPDAMLKKIEGVSQELQATLPRLSTDSTHQVSKTAGHGIHVDDPALVIGAIEEVVGKVKAAGTSGDQGAKGPKAESPESTPAGE